MKDYICSLAMGAFKRAILLTFLGILFLSYRVTAKPPVDSSIYLKNYEDTMKMLQYQRIYDRTDKDKEAANARLTRLMYKALLLPGSFSYPFDSLVTIARLTSADKRFRIINWNVPESGGKQVYEGFIQSYNPKKKKYELYVLNDKSAEINNPQTAICNPGKWMGMVYYQVIDVKKGNYYILLAIQYHSSLINHKIIDVVYFNSQGVPSFGKPVFSKLPATYKNSPKRIIFEYSAQVTMSLRYDEQKKIILFDHLSPTEPELAGQYQFYGPTFQVDGFEYDKGTWKFVSNIEARNPKTKEDNGYIAPEKGK